MSRIEIIENVVYTCPFCGKSYDNKDSADKHMLSCWLNYQDTKHCLTCKHVVEIKQAPYQGNNSDYEINLIEWLGPYDELGCNKDMCKGSCTQSWLEEEHPECWEMFDKENDEKLTEWTPEYIEFMELTMKAIEEDEELYNQIIGEDGLEVVENYEKYLEDNKIKVS